MKFKISLIALFLSILTISCQKENIDMVTPNTFDYNPDTVKVNPYFTLMKSFAPDSIYIDCISIPYPVAFTQQSGDTLTVNNDVELNNTDTLSDPIVDFVYPFTAVTRTGLTQMNKIEDLGIAIVDCSSRPANCSDKDPHVLLFYNSLNILTTNKYEYKINYPVTVEVEGKQVVLNNDDDYLPAIGGSPFNYLETELIYPITITQFGRNITLNNDDDVCDFYGTLDENCQNKPAHIQFFYNEGGGTPINCSYFINYPVDVKVKGTTKTIQTRQDYLTELNSSTTAYNDIELVFPLKVTKFNGDPDVIFNVESEICNYLENCK